MIKKSPILLAFVLVSTFAFCFSTSDPEPDKEKIQAIIKKVRLTLGALHYRPQAIDDDFSKQVFDNYMEQLDPSKRLFTAKDMDYFKNDLYNLDDYFNETKLDFFDGTVDTIFVRLGQVEKFSEEILEQPFDFEKDEKLIVETDDKEPAKNLNELKDLWRKYLKYNTLTEIVTLQKDSTQNFDDFTTLEKEARGTVADYMSDYFRRLKKRKKSKFLTQYINSFTEVYDPHTSYYSPIDKKNFEQSLSGRLEGIGARLSDEKGYATIADLIVGGPAWRSQKLEVGDKIIKVAQGKGEEVVNIVGMLLEESIELIKGKKGSEVVLTIKKKKGGIEEITLIRDVIEIQETFARSAIIQDESGERYGLIYLPEFYTDFNDKNARKASDDIAKEIAQLNKEDIKGLVFDLRNNGGGSLEEVVDIVGLFIEKGPVVQVKRSDGAMKIHQDRDKRIDFSGDMVVLVNELSASASEIMAAALQDYNRAVVIGSKQTYGKGTVQSIFPLNRFSKEDFGAVKVTIQKYYRVNGGSTQNKGVVSDIILPSRYAYAEISEGMRKNALQWDKIEKIPYQNDRVIDYSYILEQSKKRLEGNAIAKLIDQSALYLKELEDRKTIDLNLKGYKAQMDFLEKKAEEFKVLEDFDNALTVFSPQNELPRIEKDTALAEKRKNWHKDLKRDFYLQESIMVLKDLGKSAEVTRR